MIVGRGPGREERPEGLGGAKGGLEWRGGNTIGPEGLGSPRADMDSWKRARGRSAHLAFDSVNLMMLALGMAMANPLSPMS